MAAGSREGKMYHNWDVAVEIARQRHADALRQAAADRLAWQAEREEQPAEAAQRRPRRLAARRLLVSMVATTVRFMSLLF